MMMRLVAPRGLEGHAVGGCLAVGAREMGQCNGRQRKSNYELLHLHRIHRLSLLRA
jgi:hypothetical protein